MVAGGFTVGQDRAGHGRLLRCARSSNRSPRAGARPTTRCANSAGCPTADLGFARVDHHRDLRLGMPEAVYGPGKTPEHCAAVVEELLGGTDGPVLLTRATEAQVKAASAVAGVAGRHGPGTVVRERDSPRSCSVPPPPGRHGVVVVTAGTADLPVATECIAVLGALGFRPHAARATAASPVCTASWPRSTRIAMADAVVVIAGMEGALASVIGGLTPAPVVAVPTSTGYGAALEGVTALLTHAVLLLVRHHGRRASTTATAQPAPSPGCCRERGRAAQTVAWFHCFAGIAGDMALGSLLDAGADADEVRTLLEPPGAARLGPPRRGGAARRHRLHPGVVVAATTRRAHPRRHRRPDRGRRAAGPGGRAGARRLPRARHRRGGAAPAAARSGALPRGRRARRHRRHRRDGGRARGPGGRQRRGAPPWRPGPDGAQRPRPAAQPGSGHGAPARGRADLRPRRRRRADDANRRRARRHAVHFVRPAARHDDHGVGLRRGGGRARRPPELHPGGGRPAGAQRTSWDRARRRGARDQPRRRHRGAAGLRRRGRPRRRGIRCLGQPGHHEEGAARVTCSTS